MSTLHLHIGWPKTGSTALQHFCKTNADLLGQHGLAYYASRGDCSGSVVRGLVKGQDPGPMRAQFLDWAAAQTAPALLASSEAFSGCNPATLTQIFEPERWDRVEIIAYLRPQEEFLEGLYKQLIKWGLKTRLDQFLAEESPTWQRADYRANLAAWAGWCAQHGHRLHLRIFDPRALIGGNIGSDFFAAIGKPDLPGAIAARNVSPSAALIGLYLRLPAVEKLQQVNRVIVASGHPAATGRGDLFDAGMVARIRAHYAEANEEIRAAYFPERAALFDASADARPTVDTDGLDQLLIDTLARMRGAETARLAEAALRARPA